MATKVKCLECMGVFTQTDNPPGPHDIEAGVANGKMMYNTECPHCGSLDSMSENYVGVPDEVLEAYKEQRIKQQRNPHKQTNTVNSQVFVAFQEGEITEQELREKFDLD